MASCTPTDLPFENVIGTARLAESLYRPMIVPPSVSRPEPYLTKSPVETFRYTEETNEQFSITYGLGSASMTAATDHFAIAGMRVDDFAFGSAHTVSSMSST
jgi:hypothetical protein